MAKNKRLLLTITAVVVPVAAIIYAGIRFPSVCFVLYNIVQYIIGGVVGIVALVLLYKYYVLAYLKKDD